MDNKDIQIEINNLSIGYNNIKLIDEINISLISSNLIALVGRNGSGKTTFLKTLVSELKPVAGELFVDGSPISGLTPLDISKKISVVYTGREDTMGLTVRTIIEMGRHPYTGSLGKLVDSDYEIVERVIELLKIDFLLAKKMNQISDGECQKVMIARALVQDTPIILLDEPLAFLDYMSKIELLKTIQNLVKQTGKLILFSSHELNMLPIYVDGVLSVEDGKMSFIDHNIKEYIDRIILSG